MGFDTLLNKPLDHERGLVVSAAEPVEHEYEQHVEFMVHRFLFDPDDGVAVIGADLVTRNAFLRDLFDYFPVRMGSGEFTAGDFLHRNIVVVHLADRGNAV